MASHPITLWQIHGETGNSERLYFWGSKITADGDCSNEIKKMLTLWKKSYDQPGQHIKKQRHYCVGKGPSSQSYGFFSVVMYGCELDYKESLASKN